MAKDTLFDIDKEPETDHPEKGFVTCLGITFTNDQERRAYFREELRKKLPELKKIEGFPIGDDENIINLSDPPYYTACPNPWINDIIKEWELEKEELKKAGKREKEKCISEPYSLPIHSHKNHPIYNAHSYHTKVPHDVIMRYYLYYTQPGDIVVDNFGGTGMAGVAANECANSTSNIAYEIATEFAEKLKIKPQWGYRKCILGDLSPIASFITYNYTNSIEKNDFKRAATNIFQTLKNELGWMYETKHIDGRKAIINYIIWSECQVCPECGGEFVYWDEAVDFVNNKTLDPYSCPLCGCNIKKRSAEKKFESVYDWHLGETVRKSKFVPVIINYSVGGKRYERKLSEYDIEVIKKIDLFKYDSWVPAIKMEEGYNTRQPIISNGVTHVHQFYSNRNLCILSRFYELIQKYECDDRLKSFLKIWFTSCQSRLHMMNRYAPNHHRHVGPLANTLYISSTPVEISPFYFIESKISDNYFEIKNNKNIVNQIQSATFCRIKSNSIDYIFTDPPFGGNIMYSDVNTLWEGWLNLKTNNREEAICNPYQSKGLPEYQTLMTDSFKEYYRILKPGKWMTVEFSNTSAAVWNAIQYAIQQAGFVVTSVADLNKGRGGLHGIVGVTAVNQDLAISCYKPSDDIKTIMQENSEKKSDVWAFVDELLEHLSVPMIVDNKTLSIAERSPKILYDKLISYYVLKGYQVPIDAADFQKGLRERYSEKDGMFFTVSQLSDYEEKKKLAPGYAPLGIIVSDEANGIQWLHNELNRESQTYQDLQPKWMQSLMGQRKGDIIPEMRTLLEENFIQEKNGKWRCPDLQDQQDLDVLRYKSLLKEFNRYVELAQKPKSKIKEARVEALRAGFKQCYIDKDFKTIVMVGDKIPENLLTEDEVLLQYYDIASSRV